MKNERPDRGLPGRVGERAFQTEVTRAVRGNKLTKFQEQKEACCGWRATTQASQGFQKALKGFNGESAAGSGTAAAPVRSALGWEVQGEGREASREATAVVQAR